jgi:hypothetical protein
MEWRQASVSDADTIRNADRTEDEFPGNDAEIDIDEQGGSGRARAFAMA